MEKVTEADDGDGGLSSGAKSTVATTFVADATRPDLLLKCEPSSVQWAGWYGVRMAPDMSLLGQHRTQSNQRV